jgi:hypothetical protein
MFKKQQKTNRNTSTGETSFAPTMEKKCSILNSQLSILNSPFSIALLFAVLTFTACKKHGSGGNNDPKGTVYIAGNDWSGNNNIALFWKDGKVQKLTDGTHQAEAYSVYASAAGDVYVAGYENNGNYDVAKLWINGKAKSISDGKQDGNVWAVVVSGSTVYATGYDGNLAKLWKMNGSTVTSQELPFSGALYSEGAAVAVAASGDVYVAGDMTDDNNKIFAVLWKISGSTITSQMLPTVGVNLGSYATGVYVSGNDVYATGYEYDAPNVAYPKLWKVSGGTATATDLPKGSAGAYPKSVVVSGSTVYVSGKYEGEAAIWQDGVVKKLTSNGGLANAVFVSDGTVYIAGSDNSMPVFWKDGVEQKLDVINGEAASIFVK